MPQLECRKPSTLRVVLQQTRSAVGMQEGLYEPSAGSIKAALALQTMLGCAVRSGSWTLLERERVSSIEEIRPPVSRPDNGAAETETECRFVVSTSEGRTIRCKKLVVAAGAWTNDVLKFLGYRLDIEVRLLSSPDVKTTVCVRGAGVEGALGIRRRVARDGPQLPAVLLLWQEWRTRAG